MTNILTTTAALLLTASTASAVGLDRSGQSIGAIFEDGDYAELSFGYVMPEVSGNDVAAFGGSASGNVANDYSQVGMAYKHQYSDAFSAAVIFDQPYGADISYPVGGSAALGGTVADLSSNAVSVIGRYELPSNISFHGGLRVQSIKADVTLGGLAYAGLNGYNVKLDDSTGAGYLIGAAYERPDIALRVALTYFSEIEHTFDVTESSPLGTNGSTTKVTTPAAINLDFQTGVAANTLVFGSIRWAEYSTVILSPDDFAGLTGGSSLTDIDDGFAYTLGVGRKFSDVFSGQVSVGYDETGDDLVSPLAPTNGNYSLSVGGAYQLGNGVELSGGIRYVWLGDAMPETGTPDVARANFTDNHAVAIGLKVAYNF